MIHFESVKVRTLRFRSNQRSMTNRIQLLIAFYAWSFCAVAQGVVINEINVISGDDEQFVELFGLPETNLEGFSFSSKSKVP